MNDTVNKTLEAAYANPQAPQTVAMIVAGIFVAAVFLSAIYTNILRDSSVATDKPFSLARTQLMWWTLVIGLCVILYSGAYTTAPPITTTCLVLLGIGTATTMSARIIDSRQRDQLAAAGTTLTHQDQAGDGFLADILSDDSGVSVHRFQAVVFNTIYGLSFLYSFWTRNAFPDYDGQALALLGISSAGYVGLKAFENKAPTPGTGQSDELLDANAPPSMTAAG